MIFTLDKMIQKYNYCDYLVLNEDASVNADVQKVSEATPVKRILMGDNGRPILNRYGKVEEIDDLLLPNGEYVTDIYGPHKTKNDGLKKCILVGNSKYYICELYSMGYSMGYVIINRNTGERYFRELGDSHLEKIYKIGNSDTKFVIGCSHINDDHKTISLTSRKENPLYNIIDLGNEKLILGEWLDFIDNFRKNEYGEYWAPVSMDGKGYNIISENGEFMFDEWIYDIEPMDKNAYRKVFFDENEDEVNMMDDKNDMIFKHNVDRIDDIEITYFEHPYEIGHNDMEEALLYDVLDTRKRTYTPRNQAGYKFIINGDGDEVVSDYEEMEDFDGNNSEAETKVVKYTDGFYNVLNKDGFVFDETHYFEEFVNDCPDYCFIRAVKFINGKYGLFNTKTLKPVLIDKDIEFDDIKFIRLLNEYNILAVRRGDKCNLVAIDPNEDGTDRFFSNIDYLSSVFYTWIDDIKVLPGGNFLFITHSNGIDYLLWKGAKEHYCKVEYILKTTNDVYTIMNDEEKFNFISVNEEEMFSEKWFDCCFDFGNDDFDSYKSYNDDGWFPVVGYNGKFTYINAENFCFLFQEDHDNNDFETVRWFDDCDAYKKTKNGYVFGVVEDGVKKYLDDYGNEVDKDGNDI